MLFPAFDPDTSVCFVGGRGDTSIRYFDISAATDGPETALCTFLNQTPSGSSPISGFCLMPKKMCSVRNIEANRILKLTLDSVVPVSFFVPRADHLKQYFQDDVFPPTKLNPTATCAEWVDSSSVPTAPVLTSLKPDDMSVLSSHRESLASPQASKSKVSSFKADLLKQEEDKRNKEAMFDKMQQMALQRAQYHPVASGGGASSGKPSANESKDGKDDDSDGGWDD